MIRKRIWLAAVMIASCILISGVNVMASTGDAVVTFKNKTDKFTITGKENLTQGFSGMEPGESRTKKVTLKNEYSKSMNFYMSGKVISNFADEGDSFAIYTIKLQKDGSDFFSGLIGSDNNELLEKQKNLGMEFLGNNFLIATLGENESKDVDITIELDGDSVGNDYMNRQGTIELSFEVSEVEEKEREVIDVPVRNERKIQGDPVTKTTNRTVTASAKNAKTGDELPLGILMAIAGGSLLIITGTVIARKKKTE